MKSLLFRSTALFVVSMALFLGAGTAHAARSFSVLQLNSPQPVEVTMGDPAGTALTYRVTNTATGGDVNKKIYRLRFTAAAGYSFTGAPTLPVGWAVSGVPGQTITLLAATAPCTNCLVSTGAGGTFKDFTLALGAIPTTTSDTVSTVSVVGRFDSAQNRTYNGQTFVTRRSLKAALVAYLPTQCTPDCTNWGAGCTVTSAINVGGTHSLALIVQNKSSSTWTGIISNPNPPTAVYTWAGGGPSLAGATSISLAPGACGVVTWTATMPGGRVGSVYFTARARNSTGAATSILATSNTVIVSSLAAAIGQSCVFPAETTTVTVTVTNNGASSIANVKPWGLSTTLSGNHNNSITTITVSSTAGFPAAPGTIKIEAEEITYTGMTGGTFTGCARGQNGTTAASHNNNTSVYCSRLWPVPVTTTLSGDHTSGDTTLTVASTANFLAPTPTIPFTIVIDTEALRYGSMTATTFVTTSGDRGYFGTVAAAHSNGVVVTGSPTATYLSGPTPASTATLAAGASATFTYIYRMDGFGGQVYSFQGFTSAAGGTIFSPTVPSPAGYLGYFDVSINNGDKLYPGTSNNGTFWKVANLGCTDVNRLDISVPGGFVVPGDGFDSVCSDPPTWSESFAAGIVSYIAGIPLTTAGASGTFSMLFSTVPSLPGGYNFPVTVTDNSSRAKTTTTTVTIDTTNPPPGAGTGQSWEEPTR